MLMYVLIAMAVIVVLLAILVATRPSEFRVTRSATMAAPPHAVFSQVNDFHNWRAWSPWERLDPALKRTYDGAPAGTGAGYAWSGNNKVGEGRMTNTESRPSDLIRIKLEFVRPFAATSNSEFTFKPQGDRTAMTWTMEGKNNYMARVFCLFMNMDKMVGSQFEEGLANLKAVVEGAPKPATLADAPHAHA